MTAHKIGVIEYGSGNLFSVEKALRRLGFSFYLGNDPEQLRQCTHLLLAGVGHFSHGMKILRERRLDILIQECVIEKRIPILGICLGMQLMGHSSEEGDSEGLKLVNGEVSRIHPSNGLKVPHIGWNNVNAEKNNWLFNNIDLNDRFYFTHSFAFKNLVAQHTGNTQYGDEVFFSAFIQDHIVGVQFHPEKSYDQGLQLIRNFVTHPF